MSSGFSGEQNCPSRAQHRGPCAVGGAFCAQGGSWGQGLLTLFRVTCHEWKLVRKARVPRAFPYQVEKDGCPLLVTCPEEGYMQAERLSRCCTLIRSCSMVIRDRASSSFHTLNAQSGYLLLPARHCSLFTCRTGCPPHWEPFPPEPLCTGHSPPRPSGMDHQSGTWAMGTCVTWKVSVPFHEVT